MSRRKKRPHVSRVRPLSVPLAFYMDDPIQPVTPEQWNYLETRARILQFKKRRTVCRWPEDKSNGN